MISKKLKKIEKIDTLNTELKQIKRIKVNSIRQAILAADHPPPSESVKVRHFPLAGENLTNNQP